MEDDEKIEMEHIKKLRETLKLFENYKPPTDLQLEKLSLILDDTSQFGLPGGNHSLGMAYIEFCFINKLSDDEIRRRLDRFIEIYNNTGQSPMTEKQMEFYLEFINRGWEDVAITYFNFIVKGTVTLKYAKKQT